MKIFLKIVVTILISFLVITNERKVEKRLQDTTDPNKDKEFCWKDTHTRGVGKVPKKCAPDQDRIGLLCYQKCPEGYTRFGFDCHSKCPNGWRNDGLFCRHAEYGRGAGYPWKFGDGFNDKGMFKRCARDHGGRQNCEKKGLIVYPKCKPGYWAVGCCICRPNKPKCSDYNLNAGIDLSCAKRIKIGAPKTGICEPNEDKNVGLCYPPCNQGYTGVGPVCWAAPPTGWVNCGMGAAVDSSTCGSIIMNQISSVGTMVLNIATFGAGGGVSKIVGNATKAASKVMKAVGKAKKMGQNAIKLVKGGQKAAKGGKKLSKVENLKKKIHDVKKFYDKNKKSINKVKKKGEEMKEKIEEMTDIIDKVSQHGEKPGVMIEDSIRLAAEIASSIDPTGASDVVLAYTYPKCSKYFPSGSATNNNQEASDTNESQGASEGASEGANEGASGIQDADL